LPFLNTIALLSYILAVTWAHRSIAHRIFPAKKPFLSNFFVGVMPIVCILLATPPASSNKNDALQKKTKEINQKILAFFLGITS